MVDKKVVLVYHLSDGTKQIFARQSIARAIRKKYPQFLIVRVERKIVVKEVK